MSEEEEWVVRLPDSRVEALQDLEHLFALAFSLMGCDNDPNLREASVRQLRCDLHVLGITSDELDLGGIS